MKCEVQRLYKLGQKQRAPTEPVLGELRLNMLFEGGGHRPPRLRVMLTREDKRLALPSMIDGLVIKVSEQGLVIQGTEIIPNNPSSSKTSYEYYRQTWWCKVLPATVQT